jgi:hypothetical protein
MAVHSMVNNGSEVLEVAYVWFAPGGDRSVLNVGSEMVGDWSPRPPALHPRALVMHSDPSPAALTAWRLECRERPGEPVVASLLAEGETSDARGTAYRIVHRVRGAFSADPPFGVSAIWLVDDERAREGFEESRRQLFKIRQENLPSFHSDILAEDARVPGRYLVLGLYGDEDGLDLCRTHPAVVDFARGSSVTQWAREERSLETYTVDHLRH